MTWMAPLRFLRNVLLNATNESEQLDPEVGDLIEINRIWYQHWAVYIGNGEVVHLVGPRRGPSSISSSSSSSSSSSRSSSSSSCVGEVRIDDLSDVVGRSARVNNSYSRWMYGITAGVLSTLTAVKPYSREEIKRRALSQLGPHAYDAANDNCEHFARWCRFGQGVSFQPLSYVPLP